MTLKEFFQELLLILKEKTSKTTIDKIKEYNVLTKQEFIEYIMYFYVIGYLLNLLCIVPMLFNPFGMIVMGFMIGPLIIGFFVGLWLLKQLYTEKTWALHLIGLHSLLIILSTIGEVFSLSGLIRIPCLLAYGVVVFLYGYTIKNKTE